MGEGGKWEREGNGRLGACSGGGGLWGWLLCNAGAYEEVGGKWE
jgi:hypothetical protein